MSGCRTVDEISLIVSEWIRGEAHDWRKMAYIIANTHPDSDPVRDFLLPVIEFGDSPGTRKLNDTLSRSELERVRWSDVAADLCSEVGAELKPGERAYLSAVLAAFEDED